MPDTILGAKSSEGNLGLWSTWKVHTVDTVNSSAHRQPPLPALHQPQFCYIAIG